MIQAAPPCLRAQGSGHIVQLSPAAAAETLLKTMHLYKSGSITGGVSADWYNDN